MKVEWIATFLIALIGTFLMGLSVQTTRDLSITVETIKNRMQSQEDQLAATKSQMSSVAGELTRIKETHNGDPIHPNGRGHAIMAETFLKEWPAIQAKSKAP